jgi:Na+/melibiose symporter-like transporter
MKFLILFAFPWILGAVGYFIASRFTKKTGRQAFWLLLGIITGLILGLYWFTSPGE